MVGYALLATFIAILLAARAWFARHRRSLPVYAEMKIAKSKLPRWVLVVETAIQLTFALGLTAILALALIAIAVIAGAPPNGSGFEALIGATCFVASTGPAFLLANTISMTIPAFRQANEQAFLGLQAASVRVANRELRHMSAVLVPFSVTFALLGLFWPH